MEDKKLELGEVMRLYGQLSSNSLEKSTAEQFAAEVKRAVEVSQRTADTVVNSLTSRKKLVVGTRDQFDETDADLDGAKGALLELASSVPPVVKHWKPFIDATAAVLGIDLTKIAPKDMVPDSEKLKKALDEANREILHLQQEAEGYQEQLEQANKRAADEVKALEDFAARVKDAQAAAGELVSEVTALKKQLEAAKDPAAAYSRYNEQGPNPWKTYDGKDVPKWAELPEKKNGDQVQAKWRAAVGAIITPPPPPAASSEATTKVA